MIKTRLDCVNITNFSLPFINEENENEMSEEDTQKQVVECLANFEKQRARYIKYMEDQLFKNNQAQLSAMGLNYAEQKSHPSN